jgi:ATP-dependent RNA helicase DeaD
VGHRERRERERGREREPLPVVGYTESEPGAPVPERPRRDERRRDERPRSRSAHATERPRGVPHKSFATWEPPVEADDDKPLLATPDVLPSGAGDEPREPERDDPDFAQIFLNVGRRDGARASDIQRVLTEGAGLPPEDTGRIRVRDRNTFVSVRKVSFEKALAAFAGQIIAGRNVIAEPAKQRVS